MKEIKKYDECSIIVDNDIKVMGEEQLNNSPILNMNINSSMTGALHSTLENIYNTIKDMPDVELKQHEDHTFGSLNPENDYYTLKKEVENALEQIRQFEDIILPICVNHYKKDHEEEYKMIVKIVRLNEAEKKVKLHNE